MKPEDFWAYVDKSGDCWNWTGPTNGQGRGRIKFNGRPQYAYRIAWELEHGSAIPGGLNACHHCDNPLCVRPSHIFVGTQADNARDCAQKGRARNKPRYGLDHHMTTVTPDVIATAVSEYREGDESQAVIAARYGVHQTTFGNWVRGETRADAGCDPYKRLKPHGTHAAYARHLRSGEPACQECLEGERRHCAQQRQKRLARLSGIRAADLTATEQAS